MIVGIDGNEANQEEKVGVGYFAYNLLLALYKHDHKNNYWIYLKSPPSTNLPKEKPNWHYVVCGPSKFWTRLGLPLKLYTQDLKLDLFFSPSHYTPLFCPVPKIVSIMDLGYLDNPEQFTKKDFHQLKTWTEQSIKTSKHIITISKYGQEDLISKYQIPRNKTSIVYPIFPKFTKTKNSLPKKWHLLKNQYFLFLGTLKPSKNIPFLLKAFKKYLNDSGQIKKIVIAGKNGWMYEEIFRLVNDLGLKKYILFTGYINSSQKNALLSNSTALVIPSLFEGFGIPAVEAMQASCPVIVSRAGSLPEIVGNSGLIINPHKLSSLVDALKLISIQENRKIYKKIGKKQLVNFKTKQILKQLLLAFDHAVSV